MSNGIDINSQLTSLEQINERFGDGTRMHSSVHMFKVGPNGELVKRNWLTRLITWVFNSPKSLAIKAIFQIIAIIEQKQAAAGPLNPQRFKEHTFGEQMDNTAKLINTIYTRADENFGISGINGGATRLAAIMEAFKQPPETIPSQSEPGKESPIPVDHVEDSEEDSGNSTGSFIHTESSDDYKSVLGQGSDTNTDISEEEEEDLLGEPVFTDVSENEEYQEIEEVNNALNRQFDELDKLDESDRSVVAKAEKPSQPIPAQVPIPSRKNPVEALEAVTSHSSSIPSENHITKNAFESFLTTFFNKKPTIANTIFAVIKDLVTDITYDKSTKTYSLYLAQPIKTEIEWNSKKYNLILDRCIDINTSSHNNINTLTFINKNIRAEIPARWNFLFSPEFLSLNTISFPAVVPESTKPAATLTFTSAGDRKNTSTTIEGDTLIKNIKKIQESLRTPVEEEANPSSS
ncbi:MAG: hypothetical protein P4L16_07810 [Chlamydiales bacterium]|nr:hypothetical protein [Chlamydiales bacterium]